jgi:N-acyl-D-amino-acid deacylase
MNMRPVLFPLILVAGACQAPDYDVILRHGTVYDGTGAAPTVADVAIAGDTIAAIGDLSQASGRLEIDVSGMAVAPGFINMLSWATESLIEDGLSQSDIRQGVTLEVFGEGWSMGPWTEAMKLEELEQQGDITYDITWTTLGEYLEMLERRGVSPNVASFVGATTVRIHELGYENRAPTEDELSRMQALVRTAMEEGALGVGSSLIYAPAFYADTEELIALAAVAGEYGGMYISHMRSEGNNLLGALEELITIANEADIRAEVYHLKAAGETIGARSTRSSPVSIPPAAMGWPSPPTCTPTPRGPPVSMRRCRRGSRKAASMNGWHVWPTRPRASVSSRK